MYNNYTILSGNRIVINNIETITSSMILPSTIDDFIVVGFSESVFSQNSTIVSIIIPNTIESIAPRSFYYSTIQSITFESNSQLQKIGRAAFAYSSLNNIELPYSLTFIDWDAFIGSKLVNVTIPSSVDYIGGQAFKGMSSLLEVYIPIGVDVIDYYAFICCSNLQIYVEEASKPATWNTSWASGVPVIYGVTENPIN